MDIRPEFNKGFARVRRTTAEWFLRSDIQARIILASKNRALLSGWYASTPVRKQLIGGCFTTGAEVLASIQEKGIGLLICTIDPEDGNGTGDFILTQARQIQPSLRTILIIDHDYHTAAEAAQWRSPVIISSKDFFDGTGTCRIAQLAAIGNTTYRSKSIPAADNDPLENGLIYLTERERQLLECYALGLNNNEAAERMKLSPLTCKTYSRNLLTKLRVNNRQMALLKAARLGLMRTFLGN